MLASERVPLALAPPHQPPSRRDVVSISELAGAVRRLHTGGGPPHHRRPVVREGARRAVVGIEVPESSIDVSLVPAGLGWPASLS